MNIAQLEAKHLKDRVMSDGELMEATRLIDLELNKPENKPQTMERLLSERILDYVEKQLLEEGYRKEGIDKEIFDNELIKRSVEWYKIARK